MFRCESVEAGAHRVIETGWTRAVIALGSNLGERESTLFYALADLRATEGIRVVSESSLLETIALTVSGPDPDAPRYVNQVVLIDTVWPADHLLTILLAVEETHGRVRSATPWADRTLDLDLIDYGGEVIHTERLTLPHPRAHERRFVLQPWLEVDSEAILPGHGYVADLLRQLPGDAP